METRQVIKYVGILHNIWHYHDIYKPPFIKRPVEKIKNVKWYIII